jgi:hypothetical protein
MLGCSDHSNPHLLSNSQSLNPAMGETLEIDRKRNVPSDRQRQPDREKIITSNQRLNSVMGDIGDITGAYSREKQDCTFDNNVLCQSFRSKTKISSQRQHTDFLTDLSAHITGIPKKTNHLPGNGISTPAPQTGMKIINIKQHSLFLTDLSRNITGNSVNTNCMENNRIEIAS